MTEPDDFDAREDGHQSVWFSSIQNVDGTVLQVGEKASEDQQPPFCFHRLHAEE